jgi:hypothetical protein
LHIISLPLHTTILEALASYEKFLSTADAKTNQLEIDKVKLRLPTLRRQIKLGEGVKKKP